jgi:uncharacterized FlaG/YvyC family protein
MEINPLSLISPLTPPNPNPRLEGATELTRAAVAAVRALNKTELLGDDRQLLFARDSETRKPVIRIVSRKTGEVLDQLPPERVLRILADLSKQGEGGSAS